MSVYIALVILGLGLVLFYTLLSKRVLATDGASSAGALSGTELNNVQDLFFRTVFTLLGYVAKRDGPVNAQEVKRTETFMEKMDLDSKHKREAIRLFKSGADPAFKVQQTLDDFKGLAKKSPNLAQILLVYLVNLARVDGALVNKEVEAVEEVAFGLGYSNITFKHLLKMISSQNKFAQGLEEELNSAKASNQQANKTQNNNQQKEADNNRSKQSTNKTNANVNTKLAQDEAESCEEKTRDFQGQKVNLQSAYDVLDVASSASDAELKKAYRVLVSQYHPDKLIGLGLPPYMVQAATECFKTIQAAYEYIQKARR
ncbi:MAG: co-chaperone DjlA [Cellvibrio sp.]|uniref:co-chaperone DjlA n=1 Tax=Cellvibrio sp. TaxID=1965322 RepID=UPI0031ACEE59